MKHCRHCNKELPTNRPSFCNEGCSNDFFMAKQKAKQLAEIPRVKAVCRRTGCTNEFMKVGARGKSYCCTKCQVKHNAVLAKIKRDEKLNNRPIVHRVCNACGTDFLYDRKKPRQGFCSSKCQIKNKDTRKKEIRKKETERLPKKDIDEKYLIRNCKTYAGYIKL